MMLIRTAELTDSQHEGNGEEIEAENTEMTATGLAVVEIDRAATMTEQTWPINNKREN